MEDLLDKEKKLDKQQQQQLEIALFEVNGDILYLCFLYFLSTKFPWLGNRKGMFLTSYQALHCPPVCHTRWRSGTLSLAWKLYQILCEKKQLYDKKKTTTKIYLHN